MKDKMNIISVRKEIEKVIDHTKSKLPAGITIENAFDQESGVRNRLSGLGRDFAIAIFLVLLTLLPFGYACIIGGHDFNTLITEYWVVFTGSFGVYSKSAKYCRNGHSVGFTC